MNYQNLLCLGDSQTFGARTYGCYPIHLGRQLRSASPYEWRVVNWSVNGYTARDLWLLLNQRIDTLPDTYQACLLIGTNDVGQNSDLDLFEEYYRQIVLALCVRKFKAILCGEVPPIHSDGHVFFSKQCADSRTAYNERVRRVTAEFAAAKFVASPELPRDCYEDPVHFNERGNAAVAAAFCEAILAL
jgi:lysophospholipase L1-like esterase